MTNRIAFTVALSLPLLVSACGLGVSDSQLARAQYLAQSGPFDDRADRAPTGDPLQVPSFRNWGYQEHLVGVPGNTLEEGTTRP